MIKRLFHIEQAGETDSSRQLLSLRVGERHCSFAITDVTGNQLYRLAYYAADNSGQNPLPELAGLHPELNNAFYRVLVSYDYPQGTLVAQPFYRQEEGRRILGSLFDLNKSVSVVSEPVPGWQLYNVYAVPEEVQEWIAKNFSSAAYWHEYTVGLRNTLSAVPGGHLQVDLRADDFTVLALSGSRLLLAQTYPYATPEDVLYYLLKICQQFDLSQQEVQVAVSGLVDRQSVLYRELYQYFIHMGFREPSWQTEGQEYPPHFFTTLNDLARCAS